MKIDKKKHFIRLPIYLVIVYFLASIPITVFLAHNSTQSKQYAQTGPSPSRVLYVNPTWRCIGPECPYRIDPSDKARILNPSGIVYVSPISPPPPSPIISPNDPCASSSSVAVNSYSIQSDISDDKWKEFIKQLAILFFNFILNMLGLPPIDFPNPINTPIGGPTPGMPYPSGSYPPYFGNPSPCVPGYVQPSSGQPNPSDGVGVVSPIISSPIVMPGPGGTKSNVKVVFYNFNQAPGAPYYSGQPGVIHPNNAGGVGSFDDPLTFASRAGGPYPVGSKIYVPFLQKYFVMEDLCPECVDTQVDLYMGNPSNTPEADACARELTQGSAIKEIIIDPPAGLTYDSTPIWGPSSGCITPH